jgi:uncharacterized protein YggE
MSQLMLGLLAVAVMSTLAMAQQTAEKNPTPSITVTGRGEVLASPDRAMVRLGAVAEAKDAAGAQDAVNKTVTAAIDAIKNAGIKAEAIQTEGVSLQPVYGNVRQRGTQPEITGYRASNTVAVRVDDLTLVGGVIDAGVKAGANQIQGVNFELKNDAASRKQALQQAIAQAREKADAMAAAAGVKVVAVLEIQEGGTPQVRPMMMARSAMMAEAAPTPVQPGQMNVEATVTVRYAIVTAGP